MLCPQCGADNPSSANRCGWCGAQLHAPVAAAQPAQAPAAAAQTPAGPADEVPSHMAMAVVATLVSIACCCLPFGVVAIIPASMVSGRVEQGNISGARTMSGVALGWSIVTLLISLGSVSACMLSSWSATGMVRAILGV